MRFSSLLGVCSALASLSFAEFNDGFTSEHRIVGDAPETFDFGLLKTPRFPRDTSCTNGPNSRSCWSNGFSVDTDQDCKWPNTGVTRSYSFTITNSTCNPDGAGARYCMLFNGQYPGPTIYANWGDMVEVTIHNEMENNGTSVHWHGIRQLNNNIYDGVNGVTECPMAPGYSKTYQFQATQYGTSWYHSHYSVQYGDGLAGPIVVNGPASMNYDVDLGAMPISDWYTNVSAWQENILAATTLEIPSPPPEAQNILMNGTNNIPNSLTTGKGFANVNVTKGTRYLIRFISFAVDNTFYVSIDNHTMYIIANDLVPIQPITQNFFMLAPGQRYDVVFTADQPISNYWLRATVAGDCQTANAGKGLAVLHYSGAPSGNPTATTTPPYTGNGCVEPSPMVPVVTNTVGNETSFRKQMGELDLNALLHTGATTNGQAIGVWGINSSSLHTNWEDPTMSYLISKNTSYPSTENVISIPQLGGWTYWVLQEVANGTVNIAHPMHLHGHSFYVIGEGVGQFNTTTMLDTLNFQNSKKRDTVQLQPNGYLVLAWKIDNPGVWLFHCHIAWHAAWGLGVQYLEAVNNITLPGQQYQQQCSTWDQYYNGAIYKQDDSGV